MPRSALRLLFVVVLIATALAEKGSKGKKSKKRNKGSVPAVDLSASFARQQETAFQGQGYGTKGSPWVAPIVKDSDLPAGHKNYGVNSRKPSAAVLSSPGYLEAATAINAGVEQYQRGRYDEAKKHFLRGIELSKDKHLGSMAHVNIGMVCNAQLQYQEAVKHFEAAVHLVPEDFQAKLELGNALLHSGRFAEAHTVAKEMLPIVNSMGKSKQSALTLIGNVQLANADWAGAAATFERITREFPNFAHGHIGLGEALEHMGMGPQSVAAFRRVLRVAPNDEFAVLALGRTLLRFADVLGGDSLKHLEESVKHMKRYGKLAKPNWATTFNIGVANHRLQHWEEALHYYRETQWRWAMEHNSIPVTVNLLPDENGKPSISPRDAATLAKEQSPNASERDEIVQVYFYEGEVLRKLQRYAEAEQSYNSVLRLRPIFPTAHEAVADCHEAAADFDRAIAAHRSAIRVHNEELELREKKIAYKGAPPGINSPDARSWMHWSNLLLVLLRAHRPLHEALEVLDDWHNVTRVVRDPWEVAAERIRVGLGKVERARGGRKGAGGKKGKKKKGQGQGKKGAGKRSRAEVEGEAKSGRKKEAGGALAERGGPARNWKGRVAVVYLCCKGKQDVVHMQTSLRLLHRHFLARFPYPVFILHDGHVRRREKQAMLNAARDVGASNSGGPQARGEGGLEDEQGPRSAAADVRFVSVNISAPFGRMSKVQRTCKGAYQGFCEMSRFFAGGLHDLPQLAGYDYILRLDTDSFFVTPVERDFIHESISKGCSFTLASVSVEPPHYSEGLWQTVLQAVDPTEAPAAGSWEGLFWGKKGFASSSGPRSLDALPASGGGGGLQSWWDWLWGTNSGNELGHAGEPAGMDGRVAGVGEGGWADDDDAEGEGEGVCESGAVGRECRVRARRARQTEEAAGYGKYAGYEGMGTLLKSMFTLINVGGAKPTMVWQHAGFSTSFELSHKALWRSQPYRRIWEAVDASGGVFSHRWRDAPIKSLAATMILRDEQVCFLDDLPFLHQASMPAHLNLSSLPKDSNKWFAGLNRSLYPCANPETCTYYSGVSAPDPPDPLEDPAPDGAARGGRTSQEDGRALMTGGDASTGPALDGWEGKGEGEWHLSGVGLLNDLPLPLPDDNGLLGVGGALARGCSSCASQGEVVGEL